MRPPLSLIPLLPVTLLFILGIVAAHFFTDIWWISVPVGAAIILWWNHATYSTILALAFASGCLNMHVHDQDELPADSTERFYRGLVTYSKESENSTVLYLDLHTFGDTSDDISIPIKCKAVVILPSHEHNMRCGDDVTIKTTWHKIIPRIDLPDEVDPTDGYTRHGLEFSSVVKPENVVSSEPSPVIRARLLRIRDKISDLIFRSSLSGGAKDFINTALTGNSTTFSDDTRDIFSKAGLAHILALSGLHVGIIALAATILLWPLYILRHRKLHTLLTILLLWMYALITGLSPSVTRAVIMATVFLTANLLQRHYSVWNALCLAALIILLIDPESLFSIGFQLSFAAVAGIILFARVLNPIPKHLFIRNSVVACLTISIAAMLGTAVLSAYYFHSLPIYFTLSNTIIALLLPVLLGGSVLLIVIEAFGSDPQWLCDILSLIYDFMENIAGFISRLPGATIDNLYFPAWLVIPIALCIISLRLYLKYQRIAYSISTLALIAATAGICCLIPGPDNDTALYIGRHTYRTDILIRSGNNLYLATTAPANEWESVVDEATFRYRDYMNRRNIDSITPMPYRFHDNSVTRNGRIFTIGNKVICLLSSDTMLRSSPVRPDYLLIARGYTGSIAELAEVIPADTILFGSDLHPWRLERYMKECATLDQPFRSLREQPFNIVLSSEYPRKK